MNLDLIELARNLNSRQKLAHDLLMQVRAIKNSRGANRAREIAKLESTILMMDNPGKNGQIIESKVREANNGFLERWQTTFNRLTENELLLSSFIRQGFTNSDIAQLKGIDPRSVAVSRNRLKNKLGLEPGQDLDEFIVCF